MQNQQQSKLFAFKLAEQRNTDAKPAQAWKVRDGVAAAACTQVIGSIHDMMYRDASQWNGPDGGIYC